MLSANQIPLAKRASINALRTNFSIVPSCAQPATAAAACPGNLSDLVPEGAGIAISIVERVALHSQIGTVCILDVERGVTVPRREFGKVTARGQFRQADARFEERRTSPSSAAKYRARAPISAQLPILPKAGTRWTHFVALSAASASGQPLPSDP